MKTPASPSLLRDAAAQFGTPTYVYESAVIDRQIARLQGLFSGLPVDLLYAMKANSIPAIMQRLIDAGIGIDAVSPTELLLALHLGADPNQILYSANNMEDAEMHLAHEHGVLLNIGELSRLARYGDAYPGARVSIRLNPQIGAGHHEHVITAGVKSKFGIPVQDWDAVARVIDTYHLRLVGLHQHIGSGVQEATTMWDAMQVLLEVARTHAELEFINFGGGFGIPYHAGASGLDLDGLRNQLHDALLQYKADHPSEALRFRFEPGRYFVAEAGTLLVEVNSVKQANGRTWVGTNSGFNHLIRPSMYGAHHEVYNLSNPSGSTASYYVVGNVCESGDIFARDRALQEIREGDILAILDAGAYGSSMASLYNLRSLPAEVLASGDGSFTLLRPRQRPTEILDTWLRTHQPTDA